MILSIDSGNNTGWALFDPMTRQLLACGLRSKASQLPESWQAPLTRVVIERPHTGKTRARAKDILTLAIRAGEVGGLLRYLSGIEPEYIEPNRWKGQLKKEISNKMVERKLNPEEAKLLNNIKPKSAQHNVLDAIGIGLFIVGR